MGAIHKHPATQMKPYPVGVGKKTCAWVKQELSRSLGVASPAILSPIRTTEERSNK